MLARTGGALLLASLYVYLHAAFRATGELRDNDPSAVNGDGANATIDESA